MISPQRTRQQQLPSPPPSPHSNPSTPPPGDAPTPLTLESLQSTLDDLLENYLRLLDIYTELRSQLSDSFSKGFLSLAQANFESRTPGVHYGQDFYDERMKAGRRATISSPVSKELNPKSNPSFLSYTIASVPSTSEASLPPSSSTPSSTLESKPSTETTSSKPKKAQPNPLMWFSVLPPPSLRATQTHFVSAIENTVPELLCTMMEMGKAEEEVRKVRASIKGLEMEDEDEDEDEDEESSDDEKGSTESGNCEKTENKII
ncbi:MAG: hypothetical protein M1834_003366 [Cirrosporium novae-zelandiae]|nr:MAG: hypothetical protein M1834_003366 [Cirrosporium novae-zelandiae]